MGVGEGVWGDWEIWKFGNWEIACLPVGREDCTPISVTRQRTLMLRM